MNQSRRKFLKIAGVSLLGIGTKTVFDTFAASEMPKYSRNPDVSVGKRGAMVIDP